MDNTDSKICRLRQLVNQRYSFYPKSVMKLEEENINKYDSEEEEELYKLEESEDKNVKISDELKKETNKKFVKKELGLKKKLIKNYAKNTKGNERLQKDEEILQKQKELENIEHNISSNNIETFSSQYQSTFNDEIITYFNNIENEENFGDQVKKFKSLFFHYYNDSTNINKLNDVLNDLHCIVSKFSGSSLITNVCYFKIFRYIIINNIKHNGGTNILYTEVFLMIFQEFLKQFKNYNIDVIIIEKDQSNYFNFVTTIFDMIDITLEHFIENKVYSDVLDSSINFLQHFNSIQTTLSSKLYSIYFSKHLSLKNFIFSILNKIFELIKIKSTNILSANHIKIIFLFCFTMLSYKNLANLHILTIKIISHIINNNLEYLEKLLDNILILFKQFSNSYEEMQVLFPFDERIYNNYINYYGIYKSYDNNEISLFSYLLIRIFSVLFEEFDNIKSNNSNKKEFNKFFEVFFSKITESTDSSNNFIFFVFVTDLIKVKYCIEFSIIPVVLTNLFIYFTSVIESHSVELNKRKFFLYLYEIIIDNILHDFGEMMNFYLCFKDYEGCKECFAWENQKKIKEEKMFIDCTDCLIRTNIFLDKENIDENECEFCRIEQIFNNFSNELIIDEINNKNQLKNIEKITLYQELLSLNSTKFIKYSSIFYLFSSINNDIFSEDIDFSFNIFLQQFYIHDKTNCKENNLIKSLHEFYQINRNKITLKNLNICTLFYNYFMFYLQYLNFLFISQLKLIDIILDYDNPWNLRYRSLKILEKFLIFEKENRIFKHFEIDLFVSLLEDTSLHIKEYTLEMLLLMNQNLKLSDSDLFLVLYRNINDPSILIRTKITKIIIKNYETKSNTIEKFHLKNIIFIFLSKSIDSTESLKIKNLINEFFRKNLKNAQKNPLAQTTIDLIIKICLEKEDFKNNVNLFYDNINYFASQITLKQEKSRHFLTDEDLKQFIDYILEIHFDLSNRLLVLNSLLLIKLLSSYSQKGLLAFIELFIQLLNSNEFSEDVKLDNRIKSYLCEIIANVIEKHDIKANLLFILEENLLRLILTKPIFLMYSALDTYFKIINKKKINFEKIQELVFKTVLFLQNNQNLKKSQNKNEELISVIQRSFCLISYISYLSNDNVIAEIFNFLPKIDLDTIISYIFNLLKDFLWISNDRRIKFKAFESIGYIWMRNPQFLSLSNDLIKNIMELVKIEEEKMIVIKTLNRFFTNVTKIFMQMRINKDNMENQSNVINNFDFGIVHLFFENFMEYIISLLLDNNSEIIRSQGLVLIDIIIELGNIHVYKTLPYIFALIFDYAEDVRLRANKLLDNIINLSKEKFIASLKDCLRTSFDYQRKLYMFPIYYNAFVKSSENNEATINKSNMIFNIINSENIFDLLLSKVNKKSKFHINFIEKIYSIWTEINSLDIHNEMEKTFISLDYLSFLSNLICDYRFSSFKDVSNIFMKLKGKTETDYIIFKTQLKIIKRENKKKIEKNFISFAIVNIVQISMMKYFLLKYENLDKNKDLDDEENEDELLIEKKELKIVINKDIKGMKYYEFLSSIYIHINNILLIFKKKSSVSDLIESIIMIKDFYKLPINTIRGYVSNLKKRLISMKINKEEFIKTLYSKIFPENKLDHSISLNENHPEKENRESLFRTENKKKENKLRLLKMKYNIQTENKHYKRKKD